MKVLLLPADKSGCGYYRMIEPARVIGEAHPEIEIEIDYGLDVDGTRENGETQLRWVDSRGADLVVMQRPTNRMMLEAMRMLQARGVAVAVEIDDLLSGVDAAHAGHKGLISDGAAKLVSDAAREADLVTVSTWGLIKEYARHGRGRVIPNAIPRRVAELPPAYEREPGEATVGWTGSVLTHPWDLQAVGTGLATALDHVGGSGRFTIIGQAIGARARLGLKDDPTEIPWLSDVDEYLQRVGEILDVGIAPLRVDRFNRCKSWLKPLEYASRGVYAVRSVIDEYEALGLGYRAKNAKDWASGIRNGIANPDARRAHAERNRQQVLSQHLTEHTADRWVSAWRQALDNRARA